jgi:transcriptional regulator with XRE-family HTH domain
MGGLSTPVSLTTFTDHNSMPDGVPQPFPRTPAALNRAYLSKLEKGASYPGLEIIAKLATVLEMEPAELIKLPTPQPPRNG